MRRSIKNAAGSRNDPSPPRRQRWRRFDFLVVLILFFVGPQFASAQQSEGIEELYPMGDTILSIVFHPLVMIESAGDQKLRDEFLQLANERIGIKFGEILNFTMRFGCDPQSGGQADSMFMFSMESESDIDVTSIQNSLFQRFTFAEEDHDGKKLHLDKDRGDNGPCFCAPDGNTLLLSIAPRIRALLDQQSESVDISNLLIELDGTSDLCGYINFDHDKDGIRQVVEGFFRGAPFATDAFVEAVMKIETGYFNVHVTENLVLQGTLDTGSPDTARSVAQELTNTIALLLENVRESKDDMADMPDRIRESMEPATDAMIEIFENATATADGNQVLLRIEKAGGMSGAWDKIIQSMSAGLRDFR